MTSSNVTHFKSLYLVQRPWVSELNDPPLYIPLIHTKQTDTHAKLISLVVVIIFDANTMT